MPACNKNAKINEQFDFELEAQGIRAMVKCPRCNLEQQDSAQCEYCGLVFETFRNSTPPAKAAQPKRAVLLAIILVVTGALVAAYLFVSYQDQPVENLTSVERSSNFATRTDEKDLKTVARELSGDVGILDDITSGYTKGSIIAMVIFSIVGLGYFAYGKKSRQFLMLVCGIALMGYSYFVDGMGNIILIGVGLSVLPLILGRK